MIVKSQEFDRFLPLLSLDHFPMTYNRNANANANANSTQNKTKNTL